MKTIKEVREALKANNVKGVSVRSGSGSTVGQIIVTVTSKCVFEVQDIKNILGYKNPLQSNLFIQ